MVAVKIQYPGIARTIDADFRNLSALLLPMRLGKDWDSVKAQFGEIHRMLNQEVDYLSEAESMRLARELFRPDDGIVVPHCYPEYSGKRVITTEYLQGLHLPEYLAANPAQSSRNAFGTMIYRAWFRMYFADMPYADPHPGNYLFLDDGRLGFIDFGCVQHYNAEERELAQMAEKMSYEDPSLIREMVWHACGVSADDPQLAEYMRMMEESRAWMMAPVERPGPYDFGDPKHFQRGIDWFGGVLRRGPVRAHPMYVYWNRSVFGLMALMYRLRAQVDVYTLVSEERPGGFPRQRG
jgi:predicted unusual protein kinase regulating ubiquinone biosynthesis (AarF/ABC1/UbiB family)